MISRLSYRIFRKIVKIISNILPSVAHLSAKLLCSKYLVIRALGTIIFFFLSLFLSNSYYSLVVLAKNRTPPEKRKTTVLQRIKFRLLFAKVMLTNDENIKEKFLNSITDDIMDKVILYKKMCLLMEVGHLELAYRGVFALNQIHEGNMPAPIQLSIYRTLACASFLLGKNDEANYFFLCAGNYRLSLFNPNLEIQYRIIGKNWFAALGHVAMFDYLIKYKKLYCKKKERIVVLRENNVPINTYLIEKYSKYGIYFIYPYKNKTGTGFSRPNDILDEKAIQDDYDEWAKQQGAPNWQNLSDGQRVALIDDFWEFPFPENEILGYAHAAAKIQKAWEAKKMKPLLSLSSQEEEWVANFLLRLGLPKGAWYVCIHVRESGFHKLWNKYYPSLRDANIADYYQAMKAVVDAGGWVIRMGDPSMTTIPKMERVIDYAHSKLRMPQADILLPLNCLFFIGTNSGYATIPSNYGVPCILSNWIPIGWPLWPSQDLMLPKLFKNISTGKLLTINEIFQMELAFIQNMESLPENIEVISNTPDEIENVVKDMLSCCKHKHFGIDQLGACAEIEEHYARVAERYNGFTGSRLARTFVDVHQDVFLPEVSTELKHEIEETALSC